MSILYDSTPNCEIILRLLDVISISDESNSLSISPTNHSMSSGFISNFLIKLIKSISNRLYS